MNVTQQGGPAHQFHTVFGSLTSYETGDLEVINDDPKHYVFCNVFEVACRSRPFEKVAVALNLGYVLEAIRTEGTSPWFAASHDEFAIILDGTVDVELWKLDEPDAVVPPEKQGTVALASLPAARRMGRIRAWRGHQVLLPRAAAYRLHAPTPGVMVLQTILGELTVQKWSEICRK